MLVRTGFRVTALLVCMAPLAPALAGPIDLRPKFEMGAAVEYISRSNIHHTVRVPDADIDEQVLVRTETGMTLTVTEVADDGRAVIEWKLGYIVVSTDAAIPGIEQMLDYDSRKPDQTSSPLAGLLGGLIESPVTVEVDASGKVLAFRGVTMGGVMDPLGSLAQGFFSREAFEQLPLFVTVGAPSQAKVRSTWSKKTTVPMPLGVGSLEMGQDFVFKRMSPRQRTASIEMTGVISKAAAGASLPGLGASNLGDALVVEEGTVAGTYTWDFAAGQLVSAETQVKLKTRLDTPLGRMSLEQDVSAYIERSTPDESERPRRGQPRRQGE